MGCFAVVGLVCVFVCVLVCGSLRINCFRYKMGIFPYFLVSPFVPDRLFFLALLLKLFLLCCSCSCVASFLLSFLPCFHVSLLFILLCFLAFYPSLFIGLKVTLCVIFLACFLGGLLPHEKNKKTQDVGMLSINHQTCLSFLSVFFCYLVYEEEEA